MAGRIKFRGGTTDEHSVFIGSDREITVDTTKKTLVLHDGVLAGGYEMARQSVVDTKVEKNADIVAGTATKVTYDSKGLVTSGSNPTTLNEYGITDAYTKTEVDNKDAALQTNIDTEKGRIDAMLSASDADKDSFKEIVNLINSVDTTNDTAFANYVLSNNAAVANKQDTLVSSTNIKTVNGTSILGSGDISTVDSTKLPLSGGTMTGAITAIRETKVAMAANNINLATGNLFTKTISGATTLTISGALAAGNVNSFVLELTNGGSAVITWFSGVKWAGGTAPTLTASGKDILGFYSHDGGTTWNILGINKDVK